MSIRCAKCKKLHGSTTEVRACFGIAPENTEVRDRNLIVGGPKPGDPVKAKRMEQVRAEEARNTALARQGRPHGFTSDCPQCVGIGSGHAVASRDGQDDRSMLDHEPELSPGFVDDMRQRREENERELREMGIPDPDLPIPPDPYESPVIHLVPTMPQLRYIKSLLTKHNLVISKSAADALTKRTASTLINDLKNWEPGKPLWAGLAYDDAKVSADGDPAGYGSANELPKQRQPRDTRPLPNVPAGYYAIPSLTGNNDLDFFRVDRPDSFKGGGHSHEAWIGEWKGRTFIKRIIGGKPDRNIRRIQYDDVLAAILKMGTDASGALYAQEIGRCKHCNRHLTDEVSRQRASGPDCYGTYGY